MSSRDGKKVQEFELYQYDDRGNRSSRSYRATLRMTERFEFILEVNERTYHGNNPKDLIQEAQMEVDGEVGLKWEAVIVVDPNLQDEGRLTFNRVFRASDSGGKKRWRRWSFGGTDEERRGSWHDREIKTSMILEGATPGCRDDGPHLGDRILGYTTVRWTLLVKLDEMLRDTRKAVAEKLHDIISVGDVDGFLSTVSLKGSPALLFEESKVKTENS